MKTNRTKRISTNTRTRRTESPTCLQCLFRNRLTVLLVVLLALIFATAVLQRSSGRYEGEKWAVLVSGGWGYVYYRYEADISHAYQILRKNGYNDSNIIVFMYDLAASHGNNPRRGTLIHNDKGVDYYAGVPKDYVGENATDENLIAVLLADFPNIKGGSGKLLSTGPNDRVFFFYTGHGDEKRLQMPAPPFRGCISKRNLIDALKEKRAKRGFKSMVMFINSCLAGDLGTYISPNMGIYIMTCGARHETCEAAYCSEAMKLHPPYSPEEYNICVASEFGAAWMCLDGAHVKPFRVAMSIRLLILVLKFREEVDIAKVTLQEHFETIKKRVVYSNVTQHGDLSLAKEKLLSYI